MDTKKEVNITITLILTEEECTWLHTRMQNPNETFETQNDAEMRTKFFDATRIIK